MFSCACGGARTGAWHGFRAPAAGGSGATQLRLWCEGWWLCHGRWLWYQPSRPLTSESMRRAHSAAASPSKPQVPREPHRFHHSRWSYAFSTCSWSGGGPGQQRIAWSAADRLVSSGSPGQQRTTGSRSRAALLRGAALGPQPRLEPLPKKSKSKSCTHAPHEAQGRRSIDHRRLT